MTDAKKARLEAYLKMDAILKRAKRENREVTTAERDEFDRLDTEFMAANHEVRGQAGGDVLETRGVPRDEFAPADHAFTHYLRTGTIQGLESRADGTGFSSAPNSAGVSAGSTGNFAGYMVPQGFWMNLQVAMKAYGGTANDYRRVETPTGAPMPWPTIDPTAVTASVLGASNELNQLSIADAYQFGQGMLNAWTVYTQPILASLQLVQDSAFDVDSFVGDRIGEAIGRQTAALAISGTGSGQPLGIIPALNARGAVSSSGGYLTLGAATAVKTFSGTTTELIANVLAPQTLVTMIQDVDPAYYPNAKWYMNASQAWNLRTVVDSNGRPIINFENGFDADTVTGPNYNSNAPVAKLLGFPVVIDNNIPNLTASTTGGPVFGDLSSAMVMRVVRDGATVMRLNERYADFLAVGYIGFYRLDIRSNDLRAAVTCKPAGT